MFDSRFHCEDCDSFNECEYYHNRKATSLICKEFQYNAVPKSVLEDIKAEIEQDLSWFCFDDWGNESSTWTEIKKIIDKHMESEDKE